MPSRVAGIKWKRKIPLKIKFFLWQVFHKTSSVRNLVKRGWKGDKGCFLCDHVESIDHLLLKCHLAKLVWGLIQSVFELGACPSSLEDLSVTWLQGKGPLPNSLIMFFFAGFAWALWITRNKMTIEKSFIKAPTDVLYTAISFLQRWCVYLKEKDREQVSQALEAMLGWMKNFKPRMTTASDVFKI